MDHGVLSCSASSQSETRRSDLPSSGHRQMANTLHLTMRDAIVALVLPFLTPARAACSTRAPRSSSTVSAAAPPALDFLLLDHVKVAAAAADAHSRRTELDNSTAVAMKPCRCRRVEPAALPAFALQSRLQRSELAVGTPPSSSRLTASASGCVSASMLRAAGRDLSSICACVSGLIVIGTCRTNARAIVRVQISVLDSCT